MIAVGIACIVLSLGGRGRGGPVRDAGQHIMVGRGWMVGWGGC